MALTHNHKQIIISSEPANSSPFFSQKMGTAFIKPFGFTLIELLIVIVIISIISGVALITISHNRNKNIEYFAQELTQTIILTEHEAMLRPATLGLGCTPYSYQFYIFKPPGKWQRLTDNFFATRKTPHNIQLSIKVQDKWIALNGDKPIIIFSPGGDITPFTILLGESEQNPIYQIIGEANGNIKSEPINEEA